jgi:hypothetical protein
VRTRLVAKPPRNRRRNLATRFRFSTHPLGASPAQFTRQTAPSYRSHTQTHADAQAALAGPSSSRPPASPRRPGQPSARPRRHLKDDETLCGKNSIGRSRLARERLFGPFFLARVSLGPETLVRVRGLEPPRGSQGGEVGCSGVYPGGMVKPFYLGRSKPCDATFGGQGRA